ncbi:MAG: FAD:protein FMN transferase [Candidatus Moraniibacteriota bacterium]
MEKNIFEKEFKALGTDIYLQIIASPAEALKIEKTFVFIEDFYRKKELVFSRFNPDSELTKLNKKLKEFNRASEDILYVASVALDYYAKSEGIFDPRILADLEDLGYKYNFTENEFKDKRFPLGSETSDLAQDLVVAGKEVKFSKKMDFNGIAKGYITDLVAKFLLKEGWQDFLVDSGGDMYASGLNRHSEKWGIALEGTVDENEIFLEISNKGIATSGNTRKCWEVGGRKFHHLINPKNKNEFSFDLKTVTVTAENTMKADIWAKVLFIMGIEEGISFAKKNKINSIFLKNNQEVIKNDFANL